MNENQKEYYPLLGNHKKHIITSIALVLCLLISMLGPFASLTADAAFDSTSWSVTTNSTTQTKTFTILNWGANVPSSEYAAIWNNTSVSVSPFGRGVTASKGTSGWGKIIVSVTSSATAGSYTVTASGQWSGTATVTVSKPAPATYTISYNANGGSGAPGNQTKTQNVTLTLSSTKPTRTGYDFLGWSTSSTATSATYQPSGAFTTNANTTLYAVWRVATYTVSYNANSGSGAPGNQTKTYNVALTLSSTRPTRTGYIFQGWATSASGSVVYQPGGSYTNNSAVTLYAVWQAGQVTITFNNNYLLGGSTTQSKTVATQMGTIHSNTSRIQL